MSNKILVFAISVPNKKTSSPAGALFFFFFNLPSRKCNSRKETFDMIFITASDVVWILLKQTENGVLLAASFNDLPMNMNSKAYDKIYFTVGVINSTD